MSDDPVPEIIQRPLAELNQQQWEMLCDGCGRCCLMKLEDADDGRLYLTDIVCKMYDMATAQCSCYAQRLEKVPDCVKVSLDNSDVFSDLPATCAYRLRFESKPLPDWHYLICGSKDVVEDAGISIKDKAVSEEYIHVSEFGEHIIEEIV